MAAIRENGATSGVGVLATFGYDLLGRRTSLTRGNGTVTSYAYDPASRLQQLTQDLAGTTSDLNLGFTYNPAGQILSNTRSNDLYSFAPAAGTTNTSVNGLNQPTQIGGASTSHDARGNMTNDGTTSYVYNSQNLLMNAGGVRLNYDAMWRLSVVAWGTAANESRRFDYDGIDLIAEYVTGSLTRRYVHGPGIDEPLVEYEGSGTSSRRFLHADERGSIVALSDSAGSAVAVNRYDEYGVPQSGNAGAFQYAGRPWIGEIGLYDNRARMYDPRLGRFLQTDPIGYGDGMNLYAYVGGDPVNRVDPTGLWQECTTRDTSHTTADGDMVVSSRVECYENGRDWSELFRPTPGIDFEGGGGGEQARARGPQRQGQSVVCQRLARRVNAAARRLSRYSRNPRIWNDPVGLDFLKRTFEDNASDAYWASWLVGAASIPLSLLPTTRIGGAIVGVTGLSAGQGMANVQAYYEGLVRDIEARLHQLEAQGDGTCPS